MHLYTRRGIWYTKIYVAGKPKYLTLKIRAKGPAERREAMRKALELEKNMRAGLHGPLDLTWASAVEQYLHAHRAAGKPKSRQTRIDKMGRFLAHIDREARIPADEKAVKTLINDYLQTRLAGKASPGTVKADRVYLHHLCEWLREEKGFGWTRNPARARAHGNVPKPPRRRPRRYTLAQEATLMLAVERTRLWPLFLLKCDLGLRTSEAIDLRWDRWHSESRQLEILDTKTHRDRVVTVPPETCQALEDLPRRGPYIVASPAGNQWDVHNLANEWRATMRAAELDPTWYTMARLRKAAISRALNGGMPPATASAVFGTSIKIILEHYAELDTERADVFLGLGRDGRRSLQAPSEPNLDNRPAMRIVPATGMVGSAAISAAVA